MFMQRAPLSAASHDDAVPRSPWAACPEPCALQGELAIKNTELAAATKEAEKLLKEISENTAIAEKEKQKVKSGRKNKLAGACLPSLLEFCSRYLAPSASGYCCSCYSWQFDMS